MSACSRVPQHRQQQGEPQYRLPGFLRATGRGEIITVAHYVTHYLLFPPGLRHWRHRESPAGTGPRLACTRLSQVIGQMYLACVHLCTRVHVYATRVHAGNSIGLQFRVQVSPLQMGPKGHQGPFSVSIFSKTICIRTNLLAPTYMETIQEHDSHNMDTLAN